MIPRVSPERGVPRSVGDLESRLQFAKWPRFQLAESEGAFACRAIVIADLTAALLIITAQ
jgi:hypothetical protein